MAAAPNVPGALTPAAPLQGLPPAPGLQRWLPALRQAIQGGRPQVLVTVAQAQGSVPRDPGARLWVGPDHVTDTIGGGRLEWVAIERARYWLARGGITIALGNNPQPELLRGRVALDAAGRRELVRLPLGPRLGQCCGGAVWLLFEWLDADDLPWLMRAEQALAAGQAYTRRLAFADGTCRPLESASAPACTHTTWQADQRCLLDPLSLPQPQVVVCGAGHVGRALVQLLGTLPFQVIWLDPRDDGFPESTPAHVQCVHGDDTDVPDLPDDACWLVLTHDHALDLRLVDAILRRPGVRFLGMIGSATKAARFRSQLARRHDPQTVARLQCPIGVLPLRSKLPEVIAVSVVAQLLQVVQA